MLDRSQMEVKQVACQFSNFSDIKLLGSVWLAPCDKARCVGFVLGETFWTCRGCFVYYKVCMSRFVEVERIALYGFVRPALLELQDCVQDITSENLELIF